MKPKTNRPNWFIAIVHTVLAIVIVAICGSPFFIIISVIGNTLFRALALPGFAMSSIFFVCYALLVYFCVKLSSNYINETYIISVPQSIKNLSTTYLLILFSAFTIQAAHTKNLDGLMQYVFNNTFLMTILLVYIVAFYIASRKFIKTS